MDVIGKMLILPFISISIKWLYQFLVCFFQNCREYLLILFGLKINPRSNFSSIKTCYKCGIRIPDLNKIIYQLNQTKLKPGDTPPLKRDRQKLNTQLLVNHLSPYYTIPVVCPCLKLLNITTSIKRQEYILTSVPSESFVSLAIYFCVT